MAEGDEARVDVGHGPLVGGRRCREQVARENHELVGQGAVGELGDRTSTTALEIGRDVGQVLKDRADAPGRCDAVRPGPCQPVGPQRDQPDGQTPHLACDVLPAGWSVRFGLDQSEPRRIASRRRISRYSHTRVTTSPNAAIHAYCCGMPLAMPRSM